MVDFDCKTQLTSPDRHTNLPNRQLTPPSPSTIKLQIPALPVPFRLTNHLSPTSESATTAYEQYLRLPDLHSLWSSTNDFPGWEIESLLKPSLQALETTFRFISIIYSDPRPYSNHLEWTRRLESLVTKQLDIIARICEEEPESDSLTAPIFDANSSYGVLARRNGSSAQVWKISSESPATAIVVSRTSEFSLLPRLAAWGKTERVATKILYAIECAMRNCPYTLGLGEPNLSGKPTLDYDAVCKPSDLHALKKFPSGIIHNNNNNHNQENQTIYSVHQILECWIETSKHLLTRIESRINQSQYDRASTDCYLLEQIWNLLEEIERLHLLMDPDDFLRVKSHLNLGSGSDNAAFCFRSRGLNEVTKKSKDLKHKVPEILGVEVDPMGGPIIQEAAMTLYKEQKNERFDKIHLLQGLQAVEAALKRFYFGYKQLLVVVMGSLSANGNSSVESDSLSQIFLEPTYYPSLDGAKTFLGGFWEHETAAACGRRH